MMYHDTYQTRTKRCRDTPQVQMAGSTELKKTWDKVLKAGHVNRDVPLICKSHAVK